MPEEPIAAIETPAVETPQRPADMPEKFWDGNLDTSIKKWADSTRELEGKLRTPKAALSITDAPPAIDDEAGLDAVIQKAGFTQEALAATIKEKGDLSPEQYEAFKKLGYGKKMVQDTIGGIALAQQQAVDKAVGEARSLAGGQQQLDTLLTFAKGLPEALKGDLNRRLANPVTLFGAVLEIQGHYNMAIKAGQAKPMIEGSGQGGGGATGYATQQDFYKGSIEASKSSEAHKKHVARMVASQPIHTLPPH